MIISFFSKRDYTNYNKNNNNPLRKKDDNITESKTEKNKRNLLER